MKEARSDYYGEELSIYMQEMTSSYSWHGRLLLARKAAQKIGEPQEFLFSAYRMGLESYTRLTERIDGLARLGRIGTCVAAILNEPSEDVRTAFFRALDSEFTFDFTRRKHSTALQHAYTTLVGTTVKNVIHNGLDPDLDNDMTLLGEKIQYYYKKKDGTATLSDLRHITSLKSEMNARRLDRFPGLLEYIEKHRGTRATVCSGKKESTVVETIPDYVHVSREERKQRVNKVMEYMTDALKNAESLKESVTNQMEHLRELRSNDIEQSGKSLISDSDIELLRKKIEAIDVDMDAIIDPEEARKTVEAYIENIMIRMYAYRDRIMMDILLGRIENIPFADILKVFSISEPSLDEEDAAKYRRMNNQELINAMREVTLERASSIDYEVFTYVRMNLVIHELFNMHVTSKEGNTIVASDALLNEMLLRLQNAWDVNGIIYDIITKPYNETYVRSLMSRTDPVDVYILHLITQSVQQQQQMHKVVGNDDAMVQMWSQYSNELYRAFSLKMLEHKRVIQQVKAEVTEEGDECRWVRYKELMVGNKSADICANFSKNVYITFSVDGNMDIYIYDDEKKNLISIVNYHPCVSVRAWDVAFNYPEHIIYSDLSSEQQYQPILYTLFKRDILAENSYDDFDDQEQRMNRLVCILMCKKSIETSFLFGAMTNQWDAICFKQSTCFVTLGVQTMTSVGEFNQLINNIPGATFEFAAADRIGEAIPTTVPQLATMADQCNGNRDVVVEQHSIWYMYEITRFLLYLDSLYPHMMFVYAVWKYGWSNNLMSETHGGTDNTLFFHLVSMCALDLPKRCECIENLLKETTDWTEDFRDVIKANHNNENNSPTTKEEEGVGGEGEELMKYTYSCVVRHLLRYEHDGEHNDLCSREQE